MLKSPQEYSFQSLSMTQGTMLKVPQGNRKYDTVQAQAKKTNQRVFMTELESFAAHKDSGMLNL